MWRPGEKQAAGPGSTGGGTGRHRLDTTEGLWSRREGSPGTQKGEVEIQTQVSSLHSLPKAETQRRWAAEASLVSRAPAISFVGSSVSMFLIPLIPVTHCSHLCRTCFLRLRNNFLIRILEPQSSQESAALRGCPGKLLWTVWESRTR